MRYPIFEIQDMIEAAEQRDADRQAGLHSGATAAQVEKLTTDLRAAIGPTLYELLGISVSVRRPVRVRFCLDSPEDTKFMHPDLYTPRMWYIERSEPSGMWSVTTPKPTTYAVSSADFNADALLLMISDWRAGLEWRGIAK